MSVNVAIGVQDFSTQIENHYFYVDKTAFLKEWWDSGDSVTLITRPRRFGKTLTMSMTEQFFSMEYAGRSDLFEDLEIWKEEKYRNLQGTYPVISFSFANIKEPTYELTQKKICDLIAQLYFKFDFITESNALIKEEVNLYKKIMNHMDYVDATLSLNYLSGFLYKYYGKNDWFATARPDYNDFIKAMFAGDLDAMNEYMNRVALQTFSYFDTGDSAVCNHIDPGKKIQRRTENERNYRRSD